MTTIIRMSGKQLTSFFVLLCIASTLALADNSAWVPNRSTNDPATRKGFEEFYNLEYDKAIKDFETVMQVHPDDPFAVNHVLSAVIFRELYKIGALDTEAYATDSFINKKYLQPLDPKVHERVNQLSERAIVLANDYLAK